MRGPSILMMLLLLGVPVSTAVASAPTLSESARQLADRAADRLRRLDNNPTVAVFPFSGPQGRITAEMGNVPAFLQGEMIHTLTERSGNSFLVLNKAMLARRFKDRGVAPGRIDPSDPDRTAAVLRQVGIDAAVLGSLDGLRDRETFPDVKINAGLYFASGKLDQFVGSMDPWNARPHTAGGGGVPRFESNRRLKVEVLVGGRSLPLLQCQAPGSEFCGDLFLIVPRSYLGREYQLRITNRGSPAIDDVTQVHAPGVYAARVYESNYDPQRMIGVAVFIDGINSRFLKNAYGDFVPVSRLPDKVPRWLLTPPGYTLRRTDHRERWNTGALRINDGQLVRTGGAGNSVLTLSGFQVDDKTAQAFVFADVGESLAESLGITKEIGLISVYVFPEEVPEEKHLSRKYEAAESIWRPIFEERGTKLGRPLPHNVRGFQVQLVEDFRQVWRIHYRLEGEPLPVRRSDLVAFRQ